MAVITVAGASSEIARIIIAKILATGRHQVRGLTTRDVDEVDSDGIQWKFADYDNTSALVPLLRGSDAVFCFFSSASGYDIAFERQKNLIDASIESGVRRFAPTEFGCKNYSGIPFYEFKTRVREYLEAVNKDRKVLEYSLFQTGFFTNEFCHPHKSPAVFHPLQMFIDFANRHAIRVGDGNDPFTLTTVEDLAKVIVEAIDFPGEWPAVGGIRGATVTTNELIELGKSLRGSAFQVHDAFATDISEGHLLTEWCPTMEHSHFSKEQVQELSRLATTNFLKGVLNGAWDVSDEWNQLLPHLKLTDAKEYLSAVWRSKP
ncbi:hypothetical protein F5X68DRAFT_226798 [Plectosphaerella plurivora]|uniref:NmrA-like domain-containing protein n=1 Tax=Plectosphaerella plurivora TaxID=936078 RepID=A0A9P8VMY6_9PEZI|nr:hypothetical protein F5X68DRAFT_226798 [Plectosphaerella plurivora]